MKQSCIFIAFLLVISSCRYSKDQDKTEKSKSEIIQTEKDFAQMTADSGLAAAFSHYVADSGVIQRRDTLLRGPEAVGKFYKSLRLNKVSLKWAPDFVEVSSSGDLGYTYGHFTFSSMDSAGNISSRTGIFHTVWKRQTDGNWKFVWD